MTLMKMYTLWGFCMAVVSVPWVGASELTDFGGKVKTGVLGDINTVAHPIDSIVMTAARNCELVKRLFQITYDQLKDKREPDLNKLEIYFITEEGQTIYNITEAAKEIPKNPNFRKSHKVFFFLHGFNPSNISITTVTNALLAKGSYNVFALDASKLIGWLYLRSTTYIRFIGEKLGEIIVALSNEGGVEADEITLVGHSLGAHIASYASKKYSSLTNKLIGRVTGLDPAGPCFENLKDDLRLKKTDAKFVDVVHSDAEVYGTADMLGQVDYCPNGGYNQPDCLLQTCSHSRAWELFASSVTNPKLFPSVKCKSWDDFKRNKCNDSDTSYMGYGSTPESFGVYWLVTEGEYPYGLGEEGKKYTGGNGALSQIEFQLSD